MKRLFSIVFASLILLSGMHLTVASHICCGELAAVKYSFTGELAGCGMENGQDPVSPQGALHTDCCKNHVTSCSADNTYFSSSNFSKTAARELPPACSAIISYTAPSPVLNRSWSMKEGPPDTRPVSAVDQSFICVLII